MWEIFMYKIFVYGTLKSEYLQNKLLGHTLESYDAKLEGYSINTGGKYFNVIPNDGGCVKGKVLLVSEKDILYIDQWESVPMYMKAEVRVHSKYGYEDVYIYIKKDKEDRICLQDDVLNMSNNENLEATIDEFAGTRDTEFPVCDIYLNYHIDLSAGILNDSKKSQDVITELVKDKDISFIGYEDLYYENGGQQVSLYYTEDNEKSNLTVVIPVSICNPVKLCDKAFCGKLKTEGKDFADYIYSKYNIKVLKKPKVIIYSSGEIDKSRRVEVLAAGESDVKSNEIIEAADMDISRSEDIKVYAFNNVRIYIPKSFEPCYMDRLNSLLSCKKEGLSL
jgi:hypothetical protein